MSRFLDRSYRLQCPRCGTSAHALVRRMLATDTGRSRQHGLVAYHCRGKTCDATDTEVLAACQATDPVGW